MSSNSHSEIYLQPDNIKLQFMLKALIVGHNKRDLEITNFTNPYKKIERCTNITKFRENGSTNSHNLFTINFVKGCDVFVLRQNLFLYGTLRAVQTAYLMTRRHLPGPPVMK